MTLKTVTDNADFEVPGHLINPARIDFTSIRALADAARDTGRFPVVVHYISDNAGNTTDTAPLEIEIQLENVNAQAEALTARHGPKLRYHNIPSQDTYAAAFDLAQAARGDTRGFGNIFFVNCAPRKKQAGNGKDNVGEFIYAGILPNGTIIAGTGEESFTHFKDLIRAGELNIYKANVQIDGSQFRSRDIFPSVAELLGWYAGDPDVQREWVEARKAGNVQERDKLLFGFNAIQVESKLGLNDIPDLPSGGAIVQRRDIHLNAKTALRHEDIKQAFRDYQDIVVYARGGQAVRAVIAKAGFEKTPGTTAISAGSSGRWLDAKGKEQSAFAEVFTVAGKAIEKLGLNDDHLRHGAKIDFIPAKLLDKAKTELAARKWYKLGFKERLNDTEAARRVVEQGLVDGIDFSKLSERLLKNARPKNDAKPGAGPT